MRHNTLRIRFKPKTLEDIDAMIKKLDASNASTVIRTAIQLLHEQMTGNDPSHIAHIKELMRDEAAKWKNKPGSGTNILVDKNSETIDEEENMKHNDQNNEVQQPVEKVEKRGKNNLTHAKFYKACETLKKNKQWFLENRPNLPDASKKLSELCGYIVPYGTVSDIKDATGIQWEAKREVNKTEKSMANAKRVNHLIKFLYQLYNELGVKVPSELEQMFLDTQSAYPGVTEPSVSGPGMK